MNLNDLHKYLTDLNEKLVGILNRNTGLPGDVQENLKDAASWVSFAAENLIHDPGKAFAAVKKTRIIIDTILTRADFSRSPRLQALEVFHSLGDSYFTKSMIDNVFPKREALRR